MRPSGDDGSVAVELTYLTVLLLLPLVYLLMTVFQVQAAAFGVTEAARQAGRAFVRAPDAAAGHQRAELAAALALHDQGLTAQQPPEISCPAAACHSPGTRVEVTVRYRVRLLWLGGIFAATGPSIPVSATHWQVVDTYQGGP